MGEQLIFFSVFVEYKLWATPHTHKEVLTLRAYNFIGDIACTHT